MILNKFKFLWQILTLYQCWSSEPEPMLHHGYVSTPVKMMRLRHNTSHHKHRQARKHCFIGNLIHELIYKIFYLDLSRGCRKLFSALRSSAAIFLLSRLFTSNPPWQPRANIRDTANYCGSTGKKPNEIGDKLKFAQTVTARSVRSRFNLIPHKNHWIRIESGSHPDLDTQPGLKESVTKLLLR
jgi:hypothetical protein